MVYNGIKWSPGHGTCHAHTVSGRAYDRMKGRMTIMQHLIKIQHVTCVVSDNDIQPNTVVFKAHRRCKDKDIQRAMRTVANTALPDKRAEAWAACIDKLYMMLSDKGRFHNVYFGFMRSEGDYNLYGWIPEGVDQGEVAV